MTAVGTAAQAAGADNWVKGQAPSIAVPDRDGLAARLLALATFRGDRAGQYSIGVNDQWRVCFEWRDGDAYDVEIVDYD